MRRDESLGGELSLKAQFQSTRLHETRLAGEHRFIHAYEFQSTRLHETRRNR